MDPRTVLLTTALRHRISEANIEAGFERLVALTDDAPPFNDFCDAVAACQREGLIHEPIRLPEGALQCHWHLELTPKGVVAARTSSAAQRGRAGEAVRQDGQHPLPDPPPSGEGGTLAGGCFCGAIRYEVTGAPFNPTNCHCSICRRTTGAPFVTWFSVRPHEFRFSQGTPTEFASSATGARCFCARCGTQLTFRQGGLDEIDITTSSLDHPERVPPADNTHTSSRLSWIVPNGLPDHPIARSN